MQKSLLKLHIAVFLWGFTGVLGKTIQLGEAMLVWYRILLTVIILLLLQTGTFKQIKNIPNKSKLKLAASGFIIVLHWILFYGCIKYSNVSIALTCLSASGFFTALLNPLLGDKKVHMAELLLGFLGILGVYLIFHFDPSYKIGIIIGLFSTLCSVIFSLINKHLVASLQPKTVMTFQLSAGWIILTILLPFYLHFFPEKQLIPTTADWFWLFILASFCTVLAMNLSLQALKSVSAFTQNLTLNLEPVYGIILAFVIYKENSYLNTGFYWGFGLIIFSVFLQMLRVTKKS